MIKKTLAIIIAGTACLFLLLRFGIPGTEGYAEEKKGGISGFWNLTDLLSGKLSSIVFIYEHDGLFYGRMVAIYDDDEKLSDTIENCSQKAKGISGNPPLCSFDFIYGLRFDKSKGKYTNGTILDPDSGGRYKCEAWYSPEKDELNVSGKVAIFGMTMHWRRSTEIPEGAKIQKLTPRVIKD